MDSFRLFLFFMRSIHFTCFFLPFLCVVSKGCDEPFIPDRSFVYLIYYIISLLSYVLDSPIIAFSFVSFSLYSISFFFLLVTFWLHSKQHPSPFLLLFLSSFLYFYNPVLLSSFSSIYPTAITVTLLSIIFFLFSI